MDFSESMKNIGKKKLALEKSGMKNIGKGKVKDCSGDARGCKEEMRKWHKNEKRRGGMKTCIYSLDATDSSIQPVSMSK